MNKQEQPGTMSAHFKGGLIRLLYVFIDPTLSGRGRP